MFPTRFSLAEILVLAGTAGAGGMAPPTSTRISAWLKRVQGTQLPPQYRFPRGSFPRFQIVGIRNFHAAVIGSDKQYIPSHFLGQQRRFGKRPSVPRPSNPNVLGEVGMGAPSSRLVFSLRWALLLSVGAGGRISGLVGTTLVVPLKVTESVIESVNREEALKLLWE